MDMAGNCCPNIVQPVAYSFYKMDTKTNILMFEDLGHNLKVIVGLYGCCKQRSKIFGTNLTFMYLNYKVSIHLDYTVVTN